jgi:hypothetical protein
MDRDGHMYQTSRSDFSPNGMAPRARWPVAPSAVNDGTRNPLVRPRNTCYRAVARRAPRLVCWIPGQRSAAAAIPADSGECFVAGRWSVDHVFPDQDAVPTIVEVKRRSNTRIRREVVGRMLNMPPTASSTGRSSSCARSSSASASAMPELSDAVVADVAGTTPMWRSSGRAPVRTCAPGSSAWCSSPTRSRTSCVASSSSSTGK